MIITLIPDLLCSMIYERINLKMENEFVSQTPKRFIEKYLEEEEVKLEIKSEVYRDFHPIVEYFQPI